MTDRETLKNVQEFYVRTFGFGSKFWRWLAWLGLVIGFLVIIFDSKDSTIGWRMLIVGFVILAVTRPPLPFLLIQTGSFSVRLGLSKKYQIWNKTQIERIEIAEKQIVVTPKEGRPLKLTRRLFSQETWQKMLVVFEQFKV